MQFLREYATLRSSHSCLRENEKVKNKSSEDLVHKILLRASANAFDEAIRMRPVEGSKRTEYREAFQRAVTASKALDAYGAYEYDAPVAMLDSIAAELVHQIVWLHDDARKLGTPPQ